MNLKPKKGHVRSVSSTTVSRPLLINSYVIGKDVSITNYQLVCLQKRFLVGAKEQICSLKEVKTGRGRSHLTVLLGMSNHIAKVTKYRPKYIGSLFSTGDAVKTV